MADLTTTGMVADIQRFSLHDGPGIRTTVFLKGCNMKCAWCHNPETISFEPQTLLKPEKCISCGKCAEGCYAGARVLCGQRRTVASVLEEVLLDQPYYGPEGGLTISGGEPLCQPAFTAALLEAAAEHGVNGAMESNMSLPWSAAEPVLHRCKLLMTDLKLWDSERHHAWTGIPNDRIKENIKRASQAGLPVLLRTPVVPGANDSETEIAAIAAFAATLPSLLCYELLPYHPLGLAKGSLEGFTPRQFEKPSPTRMEELGRLARKAGISVRIAGKPVKKDPPTQQRKRGSSWQNCPIASGSPCSGRKR